MPTHGITSCGRDAHPGRPRERRGGFSFIVPVALVCCALQGGVLGQSVTFNTDTTIGCSDTSFENFDVTVDNATLTIDCAHTFNSLSIINGAVVTHSPSVPMDLTITTNVLVDAASWINVDGRGFDWGNPVPGFPPGGPGAGTPNGSGPADGGSYGGAGGYGGTGRQASVLAYGSFAQPTDMGSAGGSVPPLLGAPGGGGIRMTVAGILQADGVIGANGASGVGCGVGGGAGGSIWIDAGVFTGLGVIRANGEPGRDCAGLRGGGGGGGRISIESGTNSFVGLLSAHGGYGPSSAGDGGAGTIFLRQTSSTLGDLIIDQWGADTTGRTILTGTVTVQNLTVQNNAVVSTMPGDPTLFLDVRGDAMIGSSGYLLLDGKGFDWVTMGGGPGAGTPSGSGPADGGSYGGAGGFGGTGRQAAVLSYGSFAQPTDMGSAGGNVPPSFGAQGGGVIRMAVAGILQADGVIGANGASGVGCGVGGGAGGSIWIDAGVFTGFGVIRANGEPGRDCAGLRGGGGGGGRISIESGTNSFVGLLSAHGGYGPSSAGDGGAGTIFLRQTSSTLGDLIIDQWGADTTGRTILTGTVTVLDLTVQNNAVVSTMEGDPTLFLDVRGDATIASSAYLLLDGKGFGPGQGPGAGASSGSVEGGGGAGHGGLGGIGGSGLSGGFVYDSLTLPAQLGSGGGNGLSPVLGGAGGGVLSLAVAGQLQVDGFIRADGGHGGTGGSGGQGGGGSGGSIRIVTPQLAGFGVISANGGVGRDVGGSTSDSGGGAGGRILVDSPNTAGFLGPIEAVGGAAPGAGADGADGTVFFPQAPGYFLDVQNLTAGSLASFQVVGATPATLQLLVLGLSGTANIPIPSRGVILGVQPPLIFLPTVISNVAGQATWTMFIGPAHQGVALWCQAFDLVSPTFARATNVVGMVIQ